MVAKPIFFVLNLLLQQTILNMQIPKLLAIIPARLGSKRVTQKNIRMLGDKPLIQHTLEGAVKSKCFYKIMVTTESTRIREIALNVDGVEVPWLRPKDLAGDQSHIMDSVFHTIEKYRKLGEEFDGVALLQPTSPMRSLKTIKDAIHLFTVNNYRKSIVTMSRLTETIEWAFQEQGDTVSPVFGWNNLSKRSQDLREFWAPNGLIYLASPDDLLEFGSFINPKISMLKITDNNEAIDIDTHEDWSLVDQLFNKRMEPE